MMVSIGSATAAIILIILFTALFCWCYCKKCRRKADRDREEMEAFLHPDREEGISLSRQDSYFNPYTKTMTNERRRSDLYSQDFPKFSYEL